ncbi:hypothetical protein KSP40_PGU021585 [Platanthera guangdongensis]|uniref:AAA+ ATPase domain-containing protein n=1 Tax=Platanthera guangdongensis TaxID=2320717 RepID=A0ABR2M6U2_9ASPA
MDDELLQRVLEEGGRDLYFSTPISPPPAPASSLPSSSSAAAALSSSSILQSLPLHVVTEYFLQSFDHGYYLLVKSIQELREKKDGRSVTVGIGGPSGSGKTSLAEKVASLLGCAIISMENYRNVADDGNDLDSIDFGALVRNLEDLVNGKDTLVPLFDFQEKKRVGLKAVKITSSGVVIIDGAYALHSTLRSLLDIRVAVIRINNSFVSSFRHAYYKLKCRSESHKERATYFSDQHTLETENVRVEDKRSAPNRANRASPDVESKLTAWCPISVVGLGLRGRRRPGCVLPGDASEISGEARAGAGGRSVVGRKTTTLLQELAREYPAPCTASGGGSIRRVEMESSNRRGEVAAPNGAFWGVSQGRRVETEQTPPDVHLFTLLPTTFAQKGVGRTTLGGLLALGYNVVVSFKRSCISIADGQLLMALEGVDSLNETFLVLKGTSRTDSLSEAFPPRTSFGEISLAGTSPPRSPLAETSPA